MPNRFRRSVMVLALAAGATTTITLFEVAPASAAALTVSLDTGGSTGTFYAGGNYSGCAGAVSYESGYDWDAAGNFYTRPGFSSPTPPSIPNTIPACGSNPLTRVRLELYPATNAYDPWSGVVGGIHVQRDKPAGSSTAWLNFGLLPLPTIGKLDAFRITGGIVASTPIPNNRLIVDLFQEECGWYDPCPGLKVSSGGAYVGGFATGKSRGSEWTGSVGWPGRYHVYIKDCPTGWNTSNQCNGSAHGLREISGFMDIANGQVPTLDLDAPCFGLWNCQYDFGGLATPSGGFHPLNPTRILDTRTSTGISNMINSSDGRLPNDFHPTNRINETKNHELKVTGIGGIPATGVSAVLLNVTAVTPSSTGWLSVYPRPPSGAIYDNQGTYYANPPATTSNLNFQTGEVVPNLVLARVGAGGTIRFWNASSSGMHVIADVAGWFDTSATTTPTPVLRFTGIDPARLLDTRNGIGDTAGRFKAGDDRTLQVADIPGVPADAQAVVVNITSVGSMGPGHVTAYPSLTPLPNASNLNVTLGVPRCNLAVVKVGADHKIRLFAAETEMDLIVDIFGYYSSSGGLTTPIDPVRVIDTRLGLGTPYAPFTPGETRVVQVAGVPGTGIPAGATAVMLNVTAVDTTSWGFLTVWPDGPLPISSNVNWPGGGKNTPNMVIVGVSAAGTISIFNALGNANVIVDVFGYVV